MLCSFKQVYQISSDLVQVLIKVLIHPLKAKQKLKKKCAHSVQLFNRTLDLSAAEGWVLVQSWLRIWGLYIETGVAISTVVWTDLLARPSISWQMLVFYSWVLFHEGLGSIIKKAFTLHAFLSLRLIGDFQAAERLVKSIRRSNWKQKFLTYSWGGYVVKFSKNWWSESVNVCQCMSRSSEYKVWESVEVIICCVSNSHSVTAASS